MARREAADYDDALVGVLGEGAAAGRRQGEGERRPGTPYGVTTNSPGEAPKGSYRLELTRTDGFEAEEHPARVAAEVENGKAVAQNAAAAKGCV